MQDTLLKKGDTKETPRKKYNILYVDDEEINLRLFRVAFKRHFNVIIANSGAEALELLEQHDIKLLLTDQQMPKMLGTELLEKTIEKHPNIIRIIVTGFADISVIAKAVNKCGIYKYITKPWENGELKITMDKALESYELKNDKNNLVNELEKVNASLEQKVEERTKELTEANDRLISGLAYAETIQKASLPVKEEMAKSFTDAFVLYKPKEHVSGDFYWHSRVFRDGRDLDIVAAIDCVGHGVAGALLAMIGESLLDKTVNQNGIVRADEILNRMNENLIKGMANTSNKGYETMDASILVVDKANNKAEFAGASQNLILFKGDELEIVKGTRLSIGGNVVEQNQFEKTEIDLTGVDVAYMQSDGYRDQLSDKGKIGIKRVKELLLKIQSRSMQEQKAILDKFLSQWMGTEEQTDDITLIGIKF